LKSNHKEELTRLNKDNEELTKQLDKSKKESTEHEKKIQAVVNECKRLKSNHKEELTRLNKDNEELTKLNDKNKEMYLEQLEKMKGEFIKQLNGLTSKITQYESELTEKQTKIDKLNSIHIQTTRNIDSLKSSFVVKLNKMSDKNKQYEHDIDEKQKSIDKLISRLNEFQEKRNKMVESAKQEILDNRKKCNEQIEALTKESNRKILLLENNLRKNQEDNTLLNKKIKDLQELNNEQSEQLKKLNETPEVKFTPQRTVQNVEESLKKSRDDALTKIRSQKTEITALQEDIAQLNDRVKLAEMVVSERDREIKTMIENQREIKQGFVNTLNQTKTVHERELEKRDNRIRELEHLLISKIQMAEVVKRD